MAMLSRRSLLKSGAALAAGAAGTGITAKQAHAADRAGTKYNWGHTIDFGEQYYRNMKNIICSIRRNEIDLIGDITSRMAEAIKKGGNGWMQAQAGHMGYIEFE